MRVIRWANAAGDGLEHLALAIGADGALAEGVVIGVRNGVSYGLEYQIRCAADWSVRSFDVRLAGGGALRLTADGSGGWWETGAPRADLAGCVDLDLAATPFTNTLAIRRLDLAPQQRRVIRAVYVAVPSLQATVAAQAYICLEPRLRYRYENLDTSFHAELPMDVNDVVTDYPGLFRRLAG